VCIVINVLYYILSYLRTFYAEFSTLLLAAHWLLNSSTSSGFRLHVTELL